MNNNGSQLPSRESRVIIGAGNRWRRDDGAGLAVAEAVAALHLPHVVVLTTGGEGATLLNLWQGAESVVLVDAAAGLPPGTVRRFDAHRDALPPELFGCSTHAFGVAQAVELGRTMGSLPRRLTIFALAGRDFGQGEGLSPEVAAAVPRLVHRIARELAPCPSC